MLTCEIRIFIRCKCQINFKCSEGCGLGWKSRQVTCVDKIGGGLLTAVGCMQTLKPEKRQRCISYSECVGVWLTTSWSLCSVSCGVGFQKREVKCTVNQATTVGAGEVLLAEGHCDLQAKPTSKQICGSNETTECAGSKGGRHSAKIAEWRIVSKAQVNIEINISV